MDLELMQKVAGYVDSTQKVLAKHAQDGEKCAALIPSVVEALYSRNLIEAHEKQAAAQALKNPVKALEILKAACANLSQNAAPTSLGRAEKTAAETEPVGSPSDRAFIDKLFS